MTEPDPRFTEARAVISTLSENEQLMALRLAATRIQLTRGKATCFAAMKHVAEECLWGAEWAGPLSCSQHHRQGIREG